MKEENAVKTKSGVMSETTVLAGASLVFLGFLLPWIQVRFPVGGKVVSGMGLCMKDPRLWVLPGTALAGAAFSMAAYFRRWLILHILTVLSVAAGTAALIQTHLMIHTRLNAFFIRVISNYSVKPGAYLAGAGFIVMAAGAVMQAAGKKNTGRAEPAVPQDRQ